MGREQAVPRVSVIMPVHNGMPYLPHAVDSVLGQSFQDFEFIIVNDASTDGTAAYLDGLADTRVRVIHNEQNLGVARSLNKAIAVASGEYIARQDADDVSLPGRLELQVSYLERSPGVAVVGSCATYIDDDGNVLRRCSVPSADIEIKWRLLFYNCIVHTSVTMRGWVLRTCGGYPEDTKFSRAEDYELWCRIGRQHAFANIEKPLVCYRLHGNSVSSQHLGRQTQQVRRIALANVAWTTDSCVPEQDYESVYNLLFSVASYKPGFRAGTLWSAVRLLRKLQQMFYVRHAFEPAAVLVQRSRLQWIWGKRLVALSVRTRSGSFSRITSVALGAHLLWGAFTAYFRLLLSCRREPPVSGPLLAALSVGEGK